MPSWAAQVPLAWCIASAAVCTAPVLPVSRQRAIRACHWKALGGASLTQASQSSPLLSARMGVTTGGHRTIAHRCPPDATRDPYRSRWGNLPPHALSFLPPKDIPSFRHTLSEVGWLVVAADVSSASRSFRTFASLCLLFCFVSALMSIMARLHRALLLSSLLLGPASAESIVYVTDLSIFTYLV